VFSLNQTAGDRPSFDWHGLRAAVCSFSEYGRGLLDVKFGDGNENAPDTNTSIEYF